MKRIVSACMALFLIAVSILTCFAVAPCVGLDSSVPPDYKQSDSRWADVVYSNCADPSQTIRNTGCGICAAADMIAFWFDPEVTPVEMGALSVRLDTVSDRGGTYDRFFDLIADCYPFTACESTSDIARVIICLNEGGLVIAKFSSGVWNPDHSRRHACLLYSYDIDDGFRLHDPGWPPGLMSAIIGHGSYEAVRDSVERFWLYWH